MSESTWFIIAMVIYLLVMLGIGLWSFTKTDKYEDWDSRPRSSGRRCRPRRAGR